MQRHMTSAWHAAGVERRSEGGPHPRGVPSDYGVSNHSLAHSRKKNAAQESHFEQKKHRPT